MSAVNSEKRAPGKISNVKQGAEDHGIITCSVGIDFVEGGHQGFGLLALNDALVAHFVEDLCAVFDVKQPEDLVGQECFALRCFGHWNDTIEGLDSVKTGKRFTLTSWKRKRIPDVEHESPLKRQMTHLAASMSASMRRFAEDAAKLGTAEREYTDWEATE
jgi:hypothetical protein